MKNIDEWEINTPDGWKPFSGIVELEKTTITATFVSGKSIRASNTHRLLLKSGDYIHMEDLKVGDTVISRDRTEIVKDIFEHDEITKVYDIVGVESEYSRYYTDDFVSHNCDEMAFIPNRIQADFMAGTAPSLSATRGKMMITSTPNGSRDLFAKLWFGSGMEWNKKEHSYTNTKQAKNDFVPLFVPYWLDSEKIKPDWIAREKRTLDDPLKWKVEFECLYSDTTVDVYDCLSDEYKTLTLEEMYEILKEDQMVHDEIARTDLMYNNIDTTNKEEK